MLSCGHVCMAREALDVPSKSDGVSPAHVDLWHIQQFPMLRERVRWLQRSLGTLFVGIYVGLMLLLLLLLPVHHVRRGDQELLLSHCSNTLNVCCVDGVAGTPCCWARR